MPLPIRSKSRASHDLQNVRLAIGNGQPRSRGGGASVAYLWREMALNVRHSMACLSE
jgi:hypothetical protein